MLDVVIYIYPMRREEFNTLHMTLKGIKEESTRREQGFFSANPLLQPCNSAKIQYFVKSCFHPLQYFQPGKWELQSHDSKRV